MSMKAMENGEGDVAGLHTSNSKKQKGKKKLGLFSFKSKKTYTETHGGATYDHNEPVQMWSEQVVTEVTDEVRQQKQRIQRTEITQSSLLVHGSICSQEVINSTSECGESTQLHPIAQKERLSQRGHRSPTEHHSPSDSPNHSISSGKAKHRKSKMLDFDTATHELKVRLLSGTNLAVRDSNGLSDPYVKFKFAGRTIHKSRIRYATLNPIWENEVFTTRVKSTDEILVKVLDKDIARRDDFMGSSIIEIQSLAENEEIELILTLEDEGSDVEEELGFICVAVTLTSIADKNEDVTDHDGPTPSEDCVDSTSIASVRIPEQQISHSDSNASDIGHRTGLSEMRLRKMKNPVGSVHIQLVCGKGLPARDSNGFSDPYVRFQMGKQRHRSKVCYKTLDPVWREEFVFLLTGQDSINHENAVIEITVWDKDTYRKDDFIGRCELSLGNLKYDCTEELTLTLTDALGTVTLLVTLQSNLPIKNETTCLTDLTDKYALPSTFSNISDVGFVEVKVVRASKCRAADIGGKSDPYCIIQLCNARAQTHTCYKTLDPVWNKTVTFPIKDIHDALVFTVMDEDRDGESDFLGKVAVPLLRVVNGVEKTYTLKDKKLLYRSKGTLTVRIALIYNKMRAAIRTFNPREDNHMAQEPKFKRQLLGRNFSRLWACIQGILHVGEFLNSCFTWQNPTRSATAFVVYMLFVWNVELYMVPILLLLLLGNGYFHIVLKKNKVDRQSYDQNDDFHDDEDDDDAEDANNKLSLLQRLKAIEEILLKVQNAIGWMASLLERIRNTFLWSVPYLSALAAIVLSVITLILYCVSLRTIALLYGVHKFTKRLRKPNYIPNNEVLDFLSRVPSEIEIDEFQELPATHSSPKSMKKKR